MVNGRRYYMVISSCQECPFIISDCTAPRRFEIKDGFAGGCLLDHAVDGGREPDGVVPPEMWKEYRDKGGM